MKSFKDPSFQDRTAQAAEAKKAALDKLRSKPPVDEAVLAERRAKRAAKEEAEAQKRAAREEAEAQKRAAKKAEEEREAAAKAEEEAAKAAQAAALAASMPTAAELKAARDARYAARKARK
jgi:hypothetical protein